LTTVVVTFKPTLNVQILKQHVKNLAADRGPSGDWGPSHGTTGTMDNPALGVMSLILSFFSRNLIALLANYVRAVEDRPIISRAVTVPLIPFPVRFDSVL